MFTFFSNFLKYLLACFLVLVVAGCGLFPAVKSAPVPESTATGVDANVQTGALSGKNNGIGGVSVGASAGGPAGATSASGATLTSGGSGAGGGGAIGGTTGGTTASTDPVFTPSSATPVPSVAPIPILVTTPYVKTRAQVMEEWNACIAGVKWQPPCAQVHCWVVRNRDLGDAPYPVSPGCGG